MPMPRYVAANTRNLTGYILPTKGSNSISTIPFSRHLEEESGSFDCLLGIVQDASLAGRTSRPKALFIVEPEV